MRDRKAQQTIPEAVNRGILSDGSLVANYYTSEPSPGKWIAVGTVMLWPMPRDGGFPRWLLVGVGHTEQLAVANLRARMKDAIPPRWKITCETASAESRDVLVADTVEPNGGYVVPWEIGFDDASDPLSLTMFEAAPR